MMLVEFSVANFRSFAERQTISLVAGAASRRDLRFSAPTGNRAAPEVLRVAAIFGPNNSGKSAFVRALHFFKSFVRESAKESQANDEIEVKPFKFDSILVQQPSEFEVIFITNGNQYQYGFRADARRVHEEWLFHMTRGPGQKTQRWFTRLYDPDSGEYEWYINPSVRGQKEVWRESTRDNALFLSTAIQLKAEHFQETFDWISDKLRVVPANNRISSDYTQKICTDDDSKIKVLSFLQAADTRISDILIEESEFNESMIPSVLPESLREELTKDLRGKTIRKLMTGHKTANGVIYLELSEESDGTQVLFALAGPWLDTLKTGKTLIIDELSNSLHPLVVGTLVEAFHNLDTNTGNAQLLFTGHETYVMDPRKMHRDEIYFLEKNESDATRIIPLSDFKPRGNEMFERGYLHGRYGGIPQVTSIES